jgi:hypothetical protein
MKYLTNRKKIEALEVEVVNLKTRVMIQTERINKLIEARLNEIERVKDMADQIIAIWCKV